METRPSMKETLMVRVSRFSPPRETSVTNSSVHSSSNASVAAARRPDMRAKRATSALTMPPPPPPPRSVTALSVTLPYLPVPCVPCECCAESVPLSSCSSYRCCRSCLHRMVSRSTSGGSNTADATANRGSASAARMHGGSAYGCALRNDQCSIQRPPCAALPVTPSPSSTATWAPLGGTRNPQMSAPTTEEAPDVRVSDDIAAPSARRGTMRP
mmetsp:Transcript_15853/g.25561  ORF Transcript_15853/g.25561 Transcript_15853/m.25561 type:complete len:214 (-) Transcript_15853:217-858(-)